MCVCLCVCARALKQAAGLAPDARQLVFNFYSTGASEAVEMIVTDEEQVERNGRTILSYADGEARAIAIRRFCKNFKCELIPEDETGGGDGKVILHVNLLKKSENFVEVQHLFHSTILYQRL